jgi:formylglycine-generating enzyme required for sulfatase activity
MNLLLLISCSYSLKGAPSEKDGMITIPKGIFRIGPDSVEMNARVAHDVFLEAFMIDKYEVSAKDFAKFLNNKGNPEDRYFSHDQYSTVMVRGIRILRVEGKTSADGSRVGKSSKGK